MNAYDDNQEITLTTDFSYVDVDAAMGFVDTEPDFERALECQRRIWQWVWQPPCEDLDGLFCRAAVVCWIFVPQLREYSMTQMAGRVGKKKQSLGRWVANFKTTFPEIAKHLQHIRNE